jgi:hypothetical protein
MLVRFIGSAFSVLSSKVLNPEPLNPKPSRVRMALLAPMKRAAD